MVAAMMHTCISDEAGVVRCSGANDKGELGDGTTIDRLEPVALELAAPAVYVVGEDPMCVLLTSGQVDCWGDPSWGGIGDGTNQRRDRPTKVPMLPPAKAVDGSGTRNCAVTREGALFCWGLDPELDGGGKERSVLMPEAIELPPVVEVGVGYAHVCARTEAGRVLCWGRNNWGQLGDGTTVDRKAPVELAVSDAVELAIGNFHGCARIGDGSVQCWGRDMDPRGESMGPDDRHTIGATPKAMQWLADVAQIVAGDDHACARTSAGEVLCWGSNDGGQLGDEPTEWGRPFPKALPALAGAKAIAAGAWRTCGRMADDRVACVGRTFVGREPNGSARLELTRLELTPPEPTPLEPPPAK